MTETLKLIQMNVWYWRLYWPMRRFLERERPDFILAQECIDGEKFVMADQYTSRGLLAEGLASHYIQAPGPRHDHRHGTDRMLGVGILSRRDLALVAHPVIPQRPVQADTIMPQDFSYYRLLHVTTEMAGRKVNLLTYHGRLAIDRSLPHEGRLGTPETEADMAAVAAYIDGLEGPVILTGDFNMFAAAPALLPLKRRMENLVEKNGITVARNFLAWKTDEAVSHVFVSREIDVESFHVAEDIVSDHQPLVLEFSLK